MTFGFLKTHRTVFNRTVENILIAQPWKFNYRQENDSKRTHTLFMDAILFLFFLTDSTDLAYGCFRA